VIDFESLEIIASAMGILSKKLKESNFNPRSLSMDEFMIIDEAREIIAIESQNLLEIDFLCEESGQDIENN